MDTPIPVILIDENITIRSGLRSLLTQKTNIQILGDTGYTDALSVIGQEFCVVVLRLEPKDSEKTIAFIVEAHRSHLPARLLLLAHSGDDPLVLWALKTGVRGCLVKESAEDDLETAIREIANGNVFLPSSVGNSLIENLPDTLDWNGNKSTVALPTQQMRVLRLISQGYSNEEIAHELFISKRTVDMHTYRLFRRLNVNSRTQAIQVAMQTGLIDLSIPLNGSDL